MTTDTETPVKPKSLAELRRAINPRQAHFAHLLVDGMSGRQAYAKAYGCELSTAEAQAVRLRRLRSVSEYIDALTERTEAGTTYTRQRKRERLYMIGEGIEPSSPAEQIQAIKADNDMTGDNKPVRIEGEITLLGILQSLSPTTGLPAETRRLTSTPQIAED